ncbi:unnamed protein product [Adineta steineri]|uniref:NHL repeat containing protein n=1 Tax=Adineta steineri TaxID=433720 RepID=A0A819KRU1_9BILA|nr:unnamed protein product [Adineta steineri]CAF3953535.1 unnamed protein product [Adineta steineri]
MNNRIEPDEPTIVNPNTARLRKLYDHFRKRKLIWIIFFIILIVVTIIVATITATVNKTKKEKISTTEIATTTTTPSPPSTTTTTTSDTNTKWKQSASTVAGGNGRGRELNQLSNPWGIYVDNDDQSIYIADVLNNRIVRWEFGSNNGEIVADGNGPGNEIDELHSPSDVVLDKEKKYLIICDQSNTRVVRWARRNSLVQYILIPYIACSGLAMDNNEDLYISDWVKHEVRRFQQGDKEGKVVAGGNNYGDQLNQLNKPMYIFVDGDYSIYIADNKNNRVMKWMKNAIEGILVAPGQVSNENSSSMSGPIGVIVDHTGNIYVSNDNNHQITRWSLGAIEGVPVVGEKEKGSGPTQLSHPFDLSFDQQGNLYVVDILNARIQKFDIDHD